MTDTETKLIDVLIKGLKLRPSAAITPQTTIFGKGGLGLDSVDVLEIAVLVDKHFGVSLEEDDQVNEALANIGALAAFIDQRRTPTP